MSGLPKQMLADRILVKPISEEYISKGGLIVPDVAKEKPLKGSVIMTGPGLSGNPVSVKPGDNVLFGKHAGVELIFNNEPYVIIRDVEITAIL